jgi:hypothetical protein
MKPIIAALLSAFIFLPFPAEAKVCKNAKVYGDAMKATPLAITNKPQARYFADQNWTKNCISKYGNSWCFPGDASGGKYNCKRVPSGVGTWNHTCTISAYPCKQN